MGKTSVLAAGLLPRLESQFALRYLRRDLRQGLLGTVREGLAPGAEQDLAATWLALEQSTGRPLIVVLDQAEEAYTSLFAAAGSTPETEVRALMEVARTLFHPAGAGRPRGKLLLGFRKEWLDEFEKACRSANLAFESVPLGPLDRAGVAEAVRGPASEPDLARKRAKYRLTVAPEEPPLPEFVADDLLDTLADPKKNQVSPVAPHTAALADPHVGRGPPARPPRAKLQPGAVRRPEGEGLPAGRSPRPAARRDSRGRPRGGGPRDDARPAPVVHDLSGNRLRAHVGRSPEPVSSATPEAA